MFPPKNIFLAIALLLTMPILSVAALREGDALPDLTTFQLEGKLPEKLKGQVILLDFFASWCGPCKSSFPAMEDLRKKYESAGLTILAVSIDDKRENMERFVQSTGVSFATVRDAKKKLVSAADIPAMPTSLLIDRAGKIRFLHAGFRGEETTRDYTKEIEQLLQGAHAAKIAITLLLTTLTGCIPSNPGSAKPSPTRSCNPGATPSPPRSSNTSISRAKPPTPPQPSAAADADAIRLCLKTLRHKSTTGTTWRKTSHPRGTVVCICSLEIMARSRRFPFHQCGCDSIRRAAARIFSRRRFFPNAPPA